MLAENRSTPRSDEELQKLTVGELKPHNAPITIVEYDPSWPDLFEREANRIRSVLGTKALQIEHVGSTSVPGLCAKPIIDMLLVVTNSADEPWLYVADSGTRVVRTPPVQRTRYRYQSACVQFGHIRD